LDIAVVETGSNRQRRTRGEFRWLVKDPVGLVWVRDLISTLVSVWIQQQQPSHSIPFIYEKERVV